MGDPEVNTESWNLTTHPTTHSTPHPLTHTATQPPNYSLTQPTTFQLVAAEVQLGQLQCSKTAANATWMQKDKSEPTSILDELQSGLICKLNTLLCSLKVQTNLFNTILTSTL